MSRTLKPEDRISHYRIVGPLGAGGMGEVYRAQDETLGRDVALKILPPELVRSEERVRRFVLEAKSASSLNHPHIVTIYEIGQDRVRAGDSGTGATGAGTPEPDSSPLHFISMELVSGKTLTIKIHQEKTDLKTLLGWLAQAAEGLAKAHAAGIVHRDLKPGNIMITQDGYAKVLDFGLAKLTEHQTSDPDVSGAATMTGGEQTSEGVVLGTAGYMAPEQVRGKAVDARADVFSFGCILYEAATRRRPFVAESNVETMHQILNTVPEPIEKLNPEAPTELRRLIRRCLAKGPGQRPQSMRDLALELREIAEEFDTLSASASSGSTPAVAGPRRSRVPFVVIGSAFLVVAAFAAGTMLSRRGKSGVPAAFDTMKMMLLTSGKQPESAALSPDGRFLAIVDFDQAKWSILVRQIATGSEVRVLGPLSTQITDLVFAPGGDYLHFIQDDPINPAFHDLFVIPTLGGSPRKIVHDIDSRPAFAPDGRLAFMRHVLPSGDWNLVVSSSDGTGDRVLATRRPPAAFGGPLAWSPLGDRIVAASRGWEGADSLLEYSLSSGEGNGFASLGAIRSIAWVPDGKSLVVAGRGPQLWLVSYPSGTARRITNDLNSYRELSMASDGKSLVALQFTPRGSLWALKAPDIGKIPALSAESAISDAALSPRALPDGSLAFLSFKNSSQVWLTGPDGRARKQLSPSDVQCLGVPLVVARQSGAVLFLGSRAGEAPHLWQVDPTGAQKELDVEGIRYLHDVSPHGDEILYSKMGDAALWRKRIPKGEPQRFSDLAPIRAIFSPDGKRILVAGRNASSGSRWLEVFDRDRADPLSRRPWPDGAFPPAPLASARFRWAPGADAVTFIRFADGTSNLWDLPLARGAPHPLTHFKTDQIFDFDWSFDGKWIYVCSGDQVAGVVLIRDFLPRSP